MGEQLDECGKDTFHTANSVAACLAQLGGQGIFFNSAMRQWRMVEPSTSDEAARVSTIARSVVVKSLLDMPMAVEMLEEACEKEQSTPSVLELIDVKDDGTVCHLQPFTAWRFAYYPASRVWRFTRSHREEVTVMKVAKRVGVSVALIQRWEKARSQ